MLMRYNQCQKYTEHNNEPLDTGHTYTITQSVRDFIILCFFLSFPDQK